MRKTRAIITACAVALLGACGGAGDKAADSSDQRAADTSSKPAAATAPLPGTSRGAVNAKGKAIGKIRIANLLRVSGAPGPAMDFYDVSRPTTENTPLIKDLKYGQISDYVTPHGQAVRDVTSFLYIYPAGALKPQGPLTGSNISPGYDEGDQFTVAIIATELGFGQTQITEAGKHMQPGLDLSPPAGQGVLLAESAARSEGSPLQYLVVDGSCPLPTNVGQGNQHPTSLGTGTPLVFPVSPGSHTLGVVTSPPGHGILSCAGMTPTGTLTVNVGSGDRVDVFAYDDPGAPKLVAAPTTK